MPSPLGTRVQGQVPSCLCGCSSAPAAGPPHPALCCMAFPGGVLHGHVPVCRARDPAHPRGHPARSWRWDLVLHHTEVGEAHGCHGGLTVSFMMYMGAGGMAHGEGTHAGTLFDRRGQTSSHRASHCPLYKVLLIWEWYALRKSLMRSGQLGVFRFWEWLSYIWGSSRGWNKE